MTTTGDSPRSFRRIAASVVVVILVILVTAAFRVSASRLPVELSAGARTPPWESEAAAAGPKPVTAAELAQVCSHCHLQPQPDVLPKDRWSDTIWKMVQIGGRSWNIWGNTDPESVLDWYRRQAPDRLDLPPIATDTAKGSLRLTRREIFWHDAPAPPFVASMLLLDVLGDRRPELLVSDMRNGAILLGQPGDPDSSLKPIAQIPHPAQMRAVDLDADGRMDLLVANLGSFLAMDHKLGSVEWLRQTDDGRFERITLADGLSRVSDIQPADIDGDGRLDIVVAEFGYHSTGRLFVLENRTAPGEPPTFAPRDIDGHHGASHVATTDLDEDGLPDIVALFSQELESVRGYLNQGGRFVEFRELYRAPHPAWGSSGMQLVDIDGDARLDILLTNGDTYDDSLLKPYHGIRWLQQRGPMDYEVHELTRMYGVFHAEAADINGNGLADIVACSMAEEDNVEGQVDLDQFVSVLWLDQVAPGQFVPRVIEQSACHHPTLLLGDYDQDGDIDLFVGNGRFDETAASARASVVTVWENQAD